MVELMVPRNHEVAARIHGFYEDIGWNHRNATDSKYFTYVNPEVSEGVPPVVAYWQTETRSKTIGFSPWGIYGIRRVGDKYSHYSDGLRQTMLNQLVEVCLVVPSDEDVHAIFERGGSLLEAHTHIPPRDHAGAQEFRFADPFNYSLRVTANPGWEI